MIATFWEQSSNVAGWIALGSVVLIVVKRLFSWGGRDGWR